MALISLQGVSLSLGANPLLDNIDLAIEPGERVCLTGRNGAGKSTLLSVIGGTTLPDSGNIVNSGARFGQMPQDVPLSWRGSVFDVVAEAMGEDKDNWERHGEVLGVINHLGLDSEADFSTLSGGTRRRAALARALVASRDLLLDEPTNPPDINTITWLEDFLLRKARTLVFVSHDRAFVRRLATRMVEIDRGRIYSCNCGYDLYLERREERLDAEERHFALADKKLEQEESWIRQGIKARRTRNMGRVRALQALRAERSARRERQGSVKLYAQEAERSGKLVIEAENVSFAYPGQPPLFRNFSTVVQRGDRVGLIGENGTGKTTLLRTLLGELDPSEGSVRHGTRLEISYFDQLRAELDPEASVMQNVADGNDVVTIGGQTRHVAGYLQDFLFTPDRLRLPVKLLSGGERNRLLLARLFTRPSNLLVLDEPTNDLDVETLELLEELLSDYSGTVLLVSHDRSFLDNLVTSVLALEGDGLVHEYVGAYTDWLRQRVLPDSGKTTEKRAERESAAAPEKNKPRKLSFNEQRELESLERELKNLPEALAALETEQAALEERMADPDFFSSDRAGFDAAIARHEALDAELTALLERWEEAEARMEHLNF